MSAASDSPNGTRVLLEQYRCTRRTLSCRSEIFLALSQNFLLKSKLVCSYQSRTLSVPLLLAVRGAILSYGSMWQSKQHAVGAEGET